MNKETHSRSGLKSLIWRIAGVIILASITYFFTRQWIQTGLITVIHHGVFLVIFYFHERLWLKFKHPINLTGRSIAKCITYETILGNVIIGTITYLITGSWKTMSLITVSYISVKHVVYIFNEFIWKKYISWGQK